MTKMTSSSQETSEQSKLTKQVLRKVALRSLTTTGEINKENMQGTGFGFSIMPVLRALYPEKADLKTAALRHLDYFNTYPGSVGYILGCVSQLEETSAKDPEQMPAQTVDAVKLSLMGPLAGLGDNLMMAGFRVILTILGIDLALGGNPVGPLLFLLAFSGVYLTLRLKGISVGYQQGPIFIQNLQEQKVTERLTLLLSGIKAALIGYLIFRGMASLQVPQIENLDASLSQLLPKWSIIILLAIGVWLYKKKFGRMIYIGLLALVAGLITYLIYQH